MRLKGSWSYSEWQDEEFAISGDLGVRPVFLQIKPAEVVWAPNKNSSIVEAAGRADSVETSWRDQTLQLPPPHLSTDLE